MIYKCAIIGLSFKERPTHGDEPKSHSATNKKSGGFHEIRQISLKSNRISWSPQGTTEIQQNFTEIKMISQNSTGFHWNPTGFQPVTRSQISWILGKSERPLARSSNPSGLIARTKARRGRKASYWIQWIKKMARSKRSEARNEEIITLCVVTFPGP